MSCDISTCCIVSCERHPIEVFNADLHHALVTVSAERSDSHTIEHNTVTEPLQRRLAPLVRGYRCFMVAFGLALKICPSTDGVIRQACCVDEDRALQGRTRPFC